MISHPQFLWNGHELGVYLSCLRDFHSSSVSQCPIPNRILIELIATPQGVIAKASEFSDAAANNGGWPKRRRIVGLSEVGTAVVIGVRDGFAYFLTARSRRFGEWRPPTRTVYERNVPRSEN